MHACCSTAFQSPNPLEREAAENKLLDVQLPSLNFLRAQHAMQCVLRPRDNSTANGNEGVLQRENRLVV